MSDSSNFLGLISDVQVASLPRPRAQAPAGSDLDLLVPFLLLLVSRWFLFVVR
jgi:hypothetical protein